MKWVGIEKDTEAGATAGRRWAKASRNSGRLERLRGYRFDYRDRSAIYSCFLTDRFIVAGPEEGVLAAILHPDQQSAAIVRRLLGKAQGLPVQRGREAVTLRRKFRARRCQCG
jgi:hypothetical protein